MKNTEIEFNWPLVGNQAITEFLGKSLTKNNISSAYIFSGPDNLGKTTMANYFAQILLCQKYGQSKKMPCGQCPACKSFQTQTGSNLEIGSTHGDFHIIKKDKDKKNISIEQIREFIRILGMSSLAGGFKIGVIKHADSLSEEAANALLKTLEEPKDNVVIILVAQEKDSLPATIVSRAQILNFRLVGADLIYDFLIKKHKASRSEAKNFSRLALGRPALAVKFLENKDFYEEYNHKAEVFLNFLNQAINERLLNLEDLLGKKSQGQEQVRLAKRFLEVWQGVARDLFLLAHNHNNLVQHPQTEMVEKTRFKVQDLLRWVNLLKQGEEQLSANVSPKLVLENIAINI